MYTMPDEILLSEDECATTIMGDFNLPNRLDTSETISHTWQQTDTISFR